MNAAALVGLPPGGRGEFGAQDAGHVQLAAAPRRLLMTLIELFRRARCFDLGDVDAIADGLRFREAKDLCTPCSAACSIELQDRGGALLIVARLPSLGSSYSQQVHGGARQ
ncbi:MAG: hypothetical protein RIC55_10880 [Pirellulaceae bacterium]